MYWPDWCHAKFRWLQALCSIMIVKFVNDYGTALMHVNHLPECDAPRVHEFHETYETDKSCIARLQQATHNQWFRFLRPLLWELHLLSIPFMQHGGANHCPNRLVELVSSRVKLFSLCITLQWLHGCLMMPLSSPVQHMEIMEFEGEIRHPIYFQGDRQARAWPGLINIWETIKDDEWWNMWHTCDIHVTYWWHIETSKS